MNERMNEIGLKMRKKAAEEEEEVLRRRIEELEAWHAQMKHQLIERQCLNIFQSMGQAVHVFDRQYRIRFWNPIAEKIYGVSAAEIVGKTPTEILVDPKDAVFADYLLDRTVNGETWSGEFPVTNRKGETFVIMCTNTPFRDHNGRLIGGICVFSDSRPYRSQTTSNNLDSSKVKFKEVMTYDDAIVSRKIIKLWPWKGKKDEDGEEDDVVAKLGRFGWQRLYDVAMKVFAYEEYSDDLMVLFKQEVSLMKRLRHPNILLFMGAVTCSPHHHLCIVTEFLPRGSLFEILEQHSSRLDRRRRLQMAIDIARGMNYLHTYNPPIVHRDLKSSNLLVDKNWTVKVADFGLSRIKHQTYLKTKSTGKGTPQWMAPEIIRNEQVDEKSDVYSYGVVLWEIITGKIPWGDLNPMQVIAAVGFMDRRLEIPEDVDPLWTSLIQHCWCSDPQSRPTFQQILHKLRHFRKK
ncbi:hypothetical protein E3N88_14304 [Mikania micrantha]|uniref:non-specific serine/threonine protein kinase n=1 Tax=Mikania micrantha TaxID=192012 RepID=A0A5N6P132_9ASTR|nr:hypothetical protein E3N88_14304 [Mikania micrantha]